MTDTPSTDPKLPAIVVPGSEPYETAFSKLMKGSKNLTDLEDRVRDFIRNSKIPQGEEQVTAKTGSIDPKPTELEKHVLLVRDHLLKFPELHLRVLVTGPPIDTRGFAKLFARAHCKEAKDIEDADLVVFTGGPDIDPAYYGEDPVPSYMGDDERDYEDLATYITCLEEGVPMLGVCRGAQFGAAMNGAHLYQDVDGHNGDHSMIIRRGNPAVIERISSCHHQAVMPSPGMEVLGVAFKSTVRWINPTMRHVKESKKTWEPDIEAFWFRDSCFIGIQGHPEYDSYNAFAKWTLETIQEFVTLNPDIDINQDRRRLKAEFIKERELRRQVYPPANQMPNMEPGEKQVICLGPPPTETGPIAEK